jgi:hypothetical protein
MIPDRMPEKARNELSDLLKRIEDREVECSYPITDK